MQAFWGLGEFLFPMGHSASVSLWDWGSEQQATFEKAKVLVKQTEALGISHEELPFELDASVTLEGICWALGRDNRGREYPKDFVLSSERGQKLYISP